MTKKNISNNSILDFNNNILTDNLQEGQDSLEGLKESSESFKRLQEKSNKNKKASQQSQPDEDEEEDEEDEEENEDEDEGYDIDNEDIEKASGFLKNILTKVGAGSLVALLGSLGVVGAVGTSLIGIYRVHYNGEFEFKGIGGEYQNQSFKYSNFTNFNKNGDLELSGLTKENKLTKTYYTLYSNESYYAIVEDSEKYENINDAYKKENLLTATELREQYPEIQDTEGREKMFQLNPDVLYSLDTYLHKGEFLFPQQFIKPVYYEESQNKFALKQLTDKEGNLNVKSQLFNTNGTPALDSSGNLSKKTGVWDYGLASILRYKEYDVKERDVTVLTGTTMKYMGYTNQNNSSDSKTEDKEVSQSTIGKVNSSYVAPGFSSGGTSAEKKVDRKAYAIDTAVTAGGTIHSKVEQKWQEKAGSRTTKTATYTFKETETKDVYKDTSSEPEKHTIVHTYQITYNYEVYTEEYMPYYEGDLDTSDITGSRYYRDYIKNYSNYIPKDVPSELDYSIFKDNDEVSQLLPDDKEGQYSSGNIINNNSNTETTGETFNAEFTAYTADPSEGSGTGLDAMGNVPDYRKNTCAGPLKSKYPNSVLSLGDKIVINGTGTDKDGTTCTITDTGGAIKLEADGTYKIDILVKDKATATSFGRRKGTISIVKNTNSSSTSSSNTLTRTPSSDTTTPSISLPPTREGEDRNISEILQVGSSKDSQAVLNSLKYLSSFTKYGEMYGIDPYILVAMASAESGGRANPNTTSATGIMQIENVVTKVQAYNHSTGQVEKVSVERGRLTDPDYCIKIGAMEYAQRLEDYSHNILIALQGYNYGKGGIGSTIQYYLSGGTISQNHNVDWDSVYSYAEMNHIGWITALYPGDMPIEGGNYAINRNPNDGKHDSRTWYTNTGFKKYSSNGHGSAWYIEGVLKYYAGDASPWVKKPDGTVITLDGMASSSGSLSATAVGAFNSYLASNWQSILNMKETLFPWSTELDKQLNLEVKSDYDNLKTTNLSVREQNRFYSNLTDTDVNITLNMMFALNQGNYLSKYDNMGEAEWKAMYNQLLSSPTGKTWDDKWIGFTCEEVFSKSLEDLGKLFEEDGGINPSISKKFGNTINRVTGDAGSLSQYNDINFGIDITVPEDSNVLSIANGEVISINKKSSPLSRYGIYVKIKYNGNTTMIISNLKTLDSSVKVGKKIPQGQIIGTSGGDCKSYKEGDLHIEILYKGEYINPEWIITRDMKGFEDPIEGNNSGVMCGSNKVNSTVTSDVPYVKTALEQIGKPYVYGAEGPNSFDCSGLVMWSMKQNGITISRSSKEQRKDCEYITKDQLQTGDLIFRHVGSTSVYSNVQHVMIYIGNNQYVHAPHSGKNVEIKDLKDASNLSYGRYSQALTSTGGASTTVNISGCQVSGSAVGNGTYVWPVPSKRSISSPYGMRLHPVYKVRKMHTGIDISAPMGTDIVATASGTVKSSRVRGGYGNTIEVDHGNGISSLYAHNSQNLVKEGDTVTQGQVIAKMGSTGTSTGSHSHFEIRINGQHTDPTQYVSP